MLSAAGTSLRSDEHASRQHSGQEPLMRVLRKLPNTALLSAVCRRRELGGQQDHLRGTQGATSGRRGLHPTEIPRQQDRLVQGNSGLSVHDVSKKQLPGGVLVLLGFKDQLCSWPCCHGHQPPLAKASDQDLTKGAALSLPVTTHRRLSTWPGLTAQCLHSRATLSQRQRSSEVQDPNPTQLPLLRRLAMCFSWATLARVSALVRQKRYQPPWRRSQQTQARHRPGEVFELVQEVQPRHSVGSVSRVPRSKQSIFLSMDGSVEVHTHFPRSKSDLETGLKNRVEI